MNVTAREQIHRLVDALPDDALDTTGEPAHERVDCGVQAMAEPEATRLPCGEVLTPVEALASWARKCSRDQGDGRGSSLSDAVGHSHSALPQPETLLELILEGVGKPIHLGLLRERPPNSENPPSSTPAPCKVCRRLDFADSEIEPRVISGSRFHFHMPRPSPPICESEVETVTVAYVMRIAILRWQNAAPDL